MSENKHTPGPWKVTNLENYETYHITAINQIENGKPVGDLYIASVKNRLTIYDEANAKLIASAPKLLEAAKMGLDAAIKLQMEKSRDCFDGTCNHCQYRQSNISKIQAAIAKAEGGGDSDKSK